MPQHDLVVDNGSGASVRNDINGALAALGSAMKGPNAPPAPQAGMMWLDDDTPSASVWTMKQYDGADWVELWRLDITNNMFLPGEGVIAWADVASAATLDLGAQASRHLRVTGTTAISAFGTAASGVRKELRFAAALTLNHNATSLILPGGVAISVAAGDTATAVSLGAGNWLMTDYQRANGQPLNGVIPGAAAGSGLTVSAPGLLGRSSAGSGAVEEVMLGRGLSFASGVLNSSVRGWLNFNGTGTVAIRGHEGISSITDNGTGDYSVNYSFTLPDTNYAVVFGGSSTNGRFTRVKETSSGDSNPVSKTTTAVRIFHAAGTSDPADCADVNLAIVR